MTRALGVPDGGSGENLNGIFQEIVGDTSTWLANIRDLVGVTVRRSLREFVAVRDAIVITVRQFFACVQNAIAVAVVGRIGFTFIGKTVDVAVFGRAVGNVFSIIDAICIAIHGVAESDGGRADPCIVAATGKTVSNGQHVLAIFETKGSVDIKSVEILIGSR